MSAPVIAGRATHRLAAPVADASDVELLAALRSGDRAAFGELCGRHRPRVAAYYAYAIRNHRLGALAADPSDTAARSGRWAA